MAQPELIKDIETRVKIPGDEMTGNLSIRKKSYPQFFLISNDANRYTVDELSDQGIYTISNRNYNETNGLNGVYLNIKTEQETSNNLLTLGRNKNGIYDEFTILHTGNRASYLFGAYHIQNGTDFNTILTPGYYNSSWGHGCTNYPSTNNDASMEWALMVVNTRMSTTDTGWTWQTAYPAYGDRIFHRYKGGAAAWSSWRTILDANNFSEYTLP